MYLTGVIDARLHRAAFFGPTRSLLTTIANVRHNSILYYATISSVHARRKSDRVYRRRRVKLLLQEDVAQEQVR